MDHLHRRRYRARLRALFRIVIMKTLRSFAEIPPHAKFIGAGYPDGFIDESIADALDDALEPARVRDRAGAWFYFELAREIE
jgi:hypothetical protein